MSTSYELLRDGFALFGCTVLGGIFIAWLSYLSRKAISREEAIARDLKRKS